MNIGDLVRVYCHGGLMEAGQINEYNENQLVLDLVDGTQMIILNPQKNVIAIRVSKTKEVSSDPAQVYVEPELEPEDRYDSHELNIKATAELKLMAAQEERKRAKELLSSNKITSLQEVEFGNPDYTKPVSEYSAKEVRRRIRRHRKRTLKEQNSD